MVVTDKTKGIRMKTILPLAVLLCGLAVMPACVEYAATPPAPEYVPVPASPPMTADSSMPVPPPPPAYAPPPAPASMPAYVPVPAPPPMPAYETLSAQQLDQLLGPIALYPDPLIAQILPASTLPTQIVMADRYVSGGGDPNDIEQQPWDASVQAVAHYPNVLKWMDDNLDWTTALGQAFLNQQQDVMDSVQRLRVTARNLGNLQSTPQQDVVYDDGLIDITPTDPDMVYVPTYSPDVVYYQNFYGTPFITFGVGFPIGFWLNSDFDWHHRHLVFWDRDHRRPANWWHERPADRDDWLRHQATVWHPDHRRGVAIADRGDRGWVDRTVTHPIVPAGDHHDLHPDQHPDIHPIPHPEPRPVVPREEPPHGNPHDNGQPHTVPPIVSRPEPVITHPEPPPVAPPHVVPPIVARPEPVITHPVPPPVAPPRIVPPVSPRPEPVITHPAPPPVVPRQIPPHDVPPPHNVPPIGPRPEPVITHPVPPPVVPRQIPPHDVPPPHNVPPVISRPPPVQVEHPAPVIHQPPPNNAFIGIQNPHETRDFSNRGQQSMQEFNHAAPPVSHPAPSFGGGGGGGGSHTPPPPSGGNGGNNGGNHNQGQQQRH